MKPKLKNKFPKYLLPVSMGTVIILIIGIFFIFQSNKEPRVFASPSIKLYNQTLKDKDLDRYVYNAQKSYQTSKLNSLVLEYVIETALRDMAITHEINKVSAHKEMKISNAELSSNIKNRWPTEIALNNFMIKQGYSNMNDFKKSVLQNMLWNKFMVYKARQFKIKVPQSEVLGMMEQITVSQILVSTQDLTTTNKTLRSDPEALKRANEVYQKAIAGADFKQLVKEFSDDPNSNKKDGVAFGPMPINIFKELMPKDYIETALALQENQISKPVKTDLGYHIIRLDSRYMPKGSEYQQKYLEIENELLPRIAADNPVFNDYINNVNKKAEQNMVILDPWLKASHLKQTKKWVQAAKAYQLVLKMNRYKNRIEIFLDTADVYLSLKQPEKAIQVLKQTPDTLASVDLDYLGLLATAYKDNHELEKAKELLFKFGEEHANNADVHSYLKDIYTEWHLTDLAAKETKIVAAIQKQQEQLNNSNK